jgi:YegS/Rv2252/BmrU family lipid kinase
MTKHIHVIINPASGQPQTILNTINDVFREHKATWDVSVTQQAGDGRRFAETAVANGVDLVAAYGGDGSVMEVAEGLMGSDMPLAILPGGTANIMSVELGIPRNLAKAAAVACRDTSTIRSVDMGEASGRKFMLRVGIGFPAEKVILADRSLKDKFGLAAYTIAAFKAIDTSKIVHYRMTIDGQEIEADGFACRVDNSSNIGVPDISLWPATDVSDGYLDVLLWRDIDLKTFFAAMSSLARPEVARNAFHHWRAREVSIATDQPQVIQGDGEIFDNTPVTIRVLPASMRVLVPS